MISAPRFCRVLFLSSGSQAKGHWLMLSLCTRSPTPVRFPPPPPSPAPVSGVIRGSCLNWEKGPHPAFTLPVGGGGLAGRTPESWAAGRVLGSPPSASSSLANLGQGLGGPAFLRLPLVLSPRFVLLQLHPLSSPYTLTHNGQECFRAREGATTSLCLFPVPSPRGVEPGIFFKRFYGEESSA